MSLKRFLFYYTRIFLTLVLLGVYIVIFAQTKITGTIVNKSGKAVSQANIQVIQPSDSSVLAYSFSDNNGFFSLEFQNQSKSINLAFSHLTDGRAAKKIQNINQHISIQLDGRIIEIPEVSIEKPAIKIVGDTLVYLINNFANNQDRTIGDVLKKIPGVEVDPNGTIKYNGQYINKFYVEGKDLMELRYGTITNALSNRDVESVEILQNHQPIKMLEGKIPSHQAAFNIRLKKNVSLSGRAGIGAGASPLLWNVNITPMLFTKDIQALIDLKSNNTGEDILASYDVTNVSMSGISENLKPIAFTNFLKTNTLSLPPLKSSIYLDNKSNVFSSNILKPLNSDWEIKWNIDTWQNNIRTQGNENTTILLKNNEKEEILTYEESVNNNIKDKNLKGTFFIQQNGKNNYLKNNFTFQYNRKLTDNNTDLNSNRIAQNITTPSVGFQNILTGTTVIGKNKIHQINYKSNIKYQHSEYNYLLKSKNIYLIPELDVQTQDTLKQSLDTKDLETFHSLSMQFFKGKWIFSPALDLKTVHNDLLSNLYVLNESLSSNQTAINRIIQTGSMIISRNTDRFKIKIDLPFNLQYYNIKTLEYQNKGNNLFFEPHIRTNLKLPNFWEWQMSSGINRTFGNVNQIYNNPILNALNVTKMPIDLSRQKEFQIENQWKYNNPLNSIASYITLNYTNTQKDYIYSETILDNGQRSFELLPMKNRRNSISFLGNVSKYYQNIRSNIQFNTGYTLLNTNSLIQNQFIENKVNNYVAKAKITYNQLSSLGFEYEYSFTLGTSKSMLNQVDFNQQNHFLNFYVIPIEKHAFHVNLDYYIFNYQDNQNSYPFLNLLYRFSIEKKKIDFEIKWNNIINNRDFTRLYFDQAQIIKSSYQLRPSQLLFSIKFNFR
ncbi:MULTISPECIES: carboxypeptidase-like regulatory domain-containing protein [Sphingobacterium]|uniref:carboxypeptidase-like regulatory domain-containing protein n=1 Tax=Sphingobacterium TaxID=28453 RepID=UPI00104F8F64|nr:MULTISPECIES: carboxypeptidase-like regulatory domain-containing protein [Sphingobacterium]MCW2259676.1 hypothetical protein [Sphingobacterium kitahiroshimense]TCR03480.1 hypothetical protein EDF67_112139 [Sphingobacterium sp. JUb78]